MLPAGIHSRQPGRGNPEDRLTEWLAFQVNRAHNTVQSESNQRPGLRTGLELSQDFKIQLDVKKTTTSSFQEIFRWGQADINDPNSFDYLELSPTRTGSYRISTIAVATSFMNNTSLNSEVFQKFADNRAIIQNRFLTSNLGQEYKNQSQDVLIPAFLSAYTVPMRGRSA